MKKTTSVKWTPMIMARLAARVDVNQAEIVKQLRALPGVDVAVTHMVGKGFVDIVVGYRWQNFLIELKNPDVNAYERKLTKDEQRFHDKWPGQIAVCETFEHCVMAIRYKETRNVSSKKRSKATGKRRQGRRSVKGAA
jgi:hypothetical protein